MTTDLALRVVRRVNAPRARVFDAWLDPMRLARFITPAPDFDTPDVSLDPREGGRFDILMKGKGQEIPHWGTYREITRHSRLVFTWESPFSVEGSTVTLTFHEDGDGTVVTLVQELFASEEMRTNHEKGWSAILDQLARTV